MKEVEVLDVRGAIVDDGDDEILWQAKTFGQSSASVFTVGAPPDDFTQVVFLRGRLDPEQDFTAILRTDSDYFASFRMEDLAAGTIRYEGEDLSQQAFRDRVLERCSRPPLRPVSVIRVLVGLAPFVVFGASFSWWVERRFKRPWRLFKRGRASAGVTRSGPSSTERPDQPSTLR